MKKILILLLLSFIVQVKKALFLLLLCFIVVVNAGTDWELVKDKNGIQIFSHQKPNHKLKHYKAQIRIKKNAETIIAVLLDTAACSQWVYNCISNEVVDMSDVRRRIYHTIILSPMLFKDRDFYLQSYVVYDPEEKLYTISFVSKPHYAKETIDRVRIKQVEMIWSLKYFADEMTLVTYQIYIDPKLPLKAINHRVIQKSIFQTLLGLKKIVDNPIYANKNYSKSERELLIEDK